MKLSSWKSSRPQYLVRAGVAASVALLAGACERDPEPEPQRRSALNPQARAEAKKPSPSKPSTPDRAGAEDAATPEVRVVWDVPEDWMEDPRPRPMRKATYKVPAAKGGDEDAELAVFYFGPNQGGNIEANVKRWAGQFSMKPGDLERTSREVHGLTQHVIEIDRGTYEPRGMGRPAKAKKGYGMLAGIVQAPSGPYFFKLIGPSKTVGAARKDFMELLDSVRAGE